ncbi:MAG: hypothetical protein EHM41_05500 [Chloroflexi bacterium]|nr:MAG: hypothetical protein EHM41_05500 [Chloroflexota bacterium]
MKKSKTFLLSLVVMLAATVAACIQTGQPGSTPTLQESPTPGETHYEASASYIAMDDEDQILRSEPIFLGKVQEISPTSWNQDSGEYWDSTYPANTAVAGDAGSFQVHQVRLACIQDLLADQCREAEVVVIVIGGSPTGETGSSDYQLKIGDEVVIFLFQNEIGWREGGRKLAWYFAASPMQSVYIQGEDGLFHRNLFDGSAVTLDEIQEAVLLARGTPIQSLDTVVDCSAVERLLLDSPEAQQIRAEFITHFKEQNPTEYMGLAILHRIDRVVEWVVIQGSVSGEAKDVIAVRQTPDGYQLAERYTITAPLASFDEPEKIVPEYFLEKLPDAPEVLFTCLDQSWMIGQAVVPASDYSIAFVGTDDATTAGVTQLFKIQSDGSDRTLLLSEPMLIMDLAPSPFGRQIAFWGCPGSLSAECDLGENLDVWVIDREGSHLRNLTDDSVESDMHPTWSPDGQFIAFESWRTGKAQIFIMKPDGSGIRQLTTGTDYNSVPVWSRDGNWIAYPCQQDTGDFNEPTRSCVVSPQGEPAGEPIDGVISDWSPVGPDVEARLAFRSRGEGGVDDICTAYPDGSDLVNLTNSLSREHDAVWSPDGEWIAYVAAQDGDIDIFKICAACANPLAVRLTDDPKETHWPAWSPDGSQIAYAVGQDLMVVNADGSDALYLVSGNWLQPVWLP